MSEIAALIACGTDGEKAFIDDFQGKCGFSAESKHLFLEETYGKQENTITFLLLLLLFFSIRVFFQGHRRIAGQEEKGGDHLLFHSSSSTHSQTFRSLFATLHVR